MSETVLGVHDLVKQFPIRAGILRRCIGAVHAVSGVSFELRRGETLGIVGESGCGKSTLARAVMRLVEPTSGRVTLLGTDLTSADRRQLRAARRHIQMVFQDPYASLDPRLAVRDIVAEPLRIHGVSKAAAARVVDDLFARVGLLPEQAGRSPHEFSGGQRQRIGIARALALRPTVLVLDEPVSALDVSIQAQVLNLLADLRDEFELSLVFIAHDLSVVRHCSDRVAVMYLGRIVELADREELFARPAHPYTHSLLSAVPVADPRRERRRARIILNGDVPSPAAPPTGCHFHTRCPIAQQRCVTEVPELRTIAVDHQVRCHFPLAAGESLAAAYTRTAIPRSWRAER